MGNRPPGASVVISLVDKQSYEERDGRSELSKEHLSLLHRFHNFGEDVFSWLRDNRGSGELDFKEVDGPSGQFAVRGIKPHKSAPLVAWLKQEAARQHLAITLDLHEE
ncbi:MAG: hypothetical protein EOP22_12970 [Hyphomicrobiales bacterium]|nr:MAG: hypothetical protein EOP22_12970 [Hyphomicrobiales bacterium]